MERKKVIIDYPELEAAFESGSFDTHFFLDLEKGTTILVPLDSFRELEETYVNAGFNGSFQDFDFAEYLKNSDLPPWQKEQLREIDKIYRDNEERYLSVPKQSSYKRDQDMYEFITTVGDPQRKKVLFDTAQGYGAFRKFKQALSQYGDEWDRWFRFKATRLEQRILQWLEMEQIGAEFQNKDISGEPPFLAEAAGA